MSRSINLKKVCSPDFRVACVETAKAATGSLLPGCRIVGAVLNQTGPAHLLVSTWTVGIRDAENAGWLLRGGQLKSFELLTDRSFPVRQPKYVTRIREIFGDPSIVVTNTHAKFACIWNAKWSIVIRSSMNLNRNRRWEQFDLDDSAEMLAFFRDFSAECRAQNPGGIKATEREIEEGFKRAMKSKTMGGDVMGENREDVHPPHVPASPHEDMILESVGNIGRFFGD